ncbi:MAG: aromatic amino acid hydroxylase [Pseudomonadota bacterium]|nr:aromatic amino acid hydroxylase [Pseudomonadota bacterium]
MNIEEIKLKLPKHLVRYIVEQDYSRYTSIDQAAWRYIMRRLFNFLSRNAHSCYQSGLTRSGIEIERIPNIEIMNRSLQKFGWRAVPVSGFIPPSAFMELQSLSILPIASDMRSIDHLLYTPAPDIVHEAAGHAPILVDKRYAAYLKKYAQIAKKAIISSEDIELYESIRALSDAKEDPNSSAGDIKKAEDQLNRVSKSISHISEAGYLGRMNWWTAEYGLIGSLKQPKIFGAGLLSSAEEAESCLNPSVKRIPLSIDCINYSYDITEPQPQLFVTPSFKHLENVLKELSDQMAFKTGGSAGLNKALQSKTVNTVQFSSGLQVSGILSRVYKNAAEDEAVYLNFSGPCQLCLNYRVLTGQGVGQHPKGFGSPVGKLRGIKKPIEKFGASELRKFNLAPKKNATLIFTSGVCVEGQVVSITKENGKIIIISFEKCTVRRGTDLLFDPSWGVYDMAVGEKVTSVFAGPADRNHYHDSPDFNVKIIPRGVPDEKAKRLMSLYARVREIREKKLFALAIVKEMKSMMGELISDFPNDWLLSLEVFELAFSQKIFGDIRETAHGHLKQLSKLNPKFKDPIDEGLILIISH